MARKAILVLLVAAWIGLLTLPLQVRVLKQAADVVSFEPHLAKSLWIAGLVAGAGLLMLGLSRARATAAGRAAAAAAEHAAEQARQALVGTRTRALGVSTVIFLLAALLPLTGNPYFVSVGMQTAIYAGLALGLNLVVGQAGLLVLGYAAFYAAGAYTYGILNREWGFSFWVGLPAGAVVAMLFGLLLGAPTLRLRGDYLAIVTLGFGEIMRIVLITADDLTGGPNGILGIARPKLLGYEADDAVLYWMLLGLVAFTMAVSDRLNRSRVGRAWMAMREDEKAARAMGIDITRMRLLAFTLAALWAGLCGVFFASKQGFISPESFSFLESVSVLAMVILGGMGSIPGVVFGAVVLSLLPEVLRGVAEYRMIVLAGLMILMMTFRPQGLFPNVRRKLEVEDQSRVGVKPA